MTDDKEIPAGGAPPEIDAEIVEPVSAEPPPKLETSEPGAPFFTAPKSAGLILFGVFAVLAVISGYFYFSARPAKTKIPEKAPPAEVSAAPPAPENMTLDLGQTPPHVSNAMTPDKIFNSTDGAFKEAVKSPPEREQTQGTIDALPPPPDVMDNSALQAAAKAAAGISAPGDEANASDIQAPTENSGGDPSAAIDLSSPDAQSSLENLASEQTPSPANSPGHEQSVEIDRLKTELARLRDVERVNQPATRIARLGLSYSALALKARSGASFQAEYDRFASLAGSSPAVVALGAHALEGAPTEATLKAAFPEMRDAALAASRKEAAISPIAKLGANIAGFIHLRRSAPHAGDDAGSKFSRSESLLEAGDLSGAATELEGLDGAAATAASDWIKKAQARSDLEKSLQQFDAALQAQLFSGAAER
ncbi:MAG: mitofilin family membrane protein [Parvularculaceae bacterium]